MKFKVGLKKINSFKCSDIKSNTKWRRGLVMYCTSSNNKNNPKN